MRKINSVCVVGSGSWGSALANLLADNGVDTTLYIRKKELFFDITSHNENRIYLPDIKLNRRLKFSNSLIDSIKETDLIITCIPTKYLRSVLIDIKPFIEERHFILNAAKGIENDTFFRPSEIIQDVLNIEFDRYATISGPNFAKEVALGLPTATVIASLNSKLAHILQQLFSCKYFRVYTSEDIAGVEISGAVKNVIAIAAGLSDGLRLGYNAQASLITRGLSEITRLGLMINAKSETFMGLAGIGDLVLTATGNLSRNRRFGFELSKGKKAADILSSTVTVAEGVNTVKSIHLWSQINGIDMPISKQVYEIIYNNKNPKEAVIELMERPLKKENE